MGMNEKAPCKRGGAKGISAPVHDRGQGKGVKLTKRLTKHQRFQTEKKS